MNASIFVVFLVAFLFDFLQEAQGGRPQIRAEFTKVECVSQIPKLLEVNCHINYTSKNVSTLNVDFKLAEDVINSTGTYLIAVKHGKKYENYTTTELDYCQALQMVHSNYLVQMVAVEVRRNSNLPISCPVKKNIQYYLSGFTIDPKVIPNYVPEISFKTTAVFFVNNRQAIRLITYGQVGRK